MGYRDYCNACIAAGTSPKGECPYRQRRKGTEKSPLNSIDFRGYGFIEKATENVHWTFENRFTLGEKSLQKDLGLEQ